MDPIHRSIIQENEDKLINLINFNDILPHLVPLKLFTQAMVDDFEPLNDVDRRTMLIQDLPTRGPQAFDTFGKLLLHTSQLEAARLLGFSKENGIISSRHMLTSPQASNQNGLRQDGSIGITDGQTALIRQSLQKFDGPNVYKMSSSPRGLLLLINNKDYSKAPGYDDREGTEVDARTIKRVFHELDILVDEHKDLTAKAMEKRLIEFSQLVSHTKNDIAVVVILSHGEKDCIVGVDGDTLPVKTIIRMFNNDYCKVLQGKPKLFFIQACRGTWQDHGVGKVLHTDARSDSIVERMPIFSDIVVSYSCIEDFVSYRDQFEGTWYISSLLAAICAHAHDSDIKDILQDMERRIHKFEGPQGQLVSTEIQYFGFTKKLYFNPGH